MSRLADATDLLERIAEVLYDNARRRLPAALVEETLAFSACTPPTRAAPESMPERIAAAYGAGQSGAETTLAGVRFVVEQWSLLTSRQRANEAYRAMVALRGLLYSDDDAPEPSAEQAAETKLSAVTEIVRATDGREEPRDYRRAYQAIREAVYPSPGGLEP